jgi:potassium efflux system protein
MALMGLIIASRTIGFSWHSVQWLVAAMGVGLGFGLQEIFANFISGIIILLERPVRAGDIVTVNGTTGVVHKMQLRATTILDPDRRELIVPNKKFITDDVINWTLTDPVTRLVVRIGIAYGSDTRLAHDSLLRVARQHPGVLKDPPPTAIFLAFGASSLDFELRVFISNREKYPDMQHQLHMAIDEEFRRRKIEIAFPQQDVHLKGLEPLLALHDSRDSGVAGQRAA